MLVVFNQILDIMLSKNRVISTFASFEPIYLLFKIFYYFLDADFFESQMLTEVSNREDTLILPLTQGCLLWPIYFHRFMKDEKRISTSFLVAFNSVY